MFLHIYWRSEVIFSILKQGSVFSILLNSISCPPVVIPKAYCEYCAAHQLECLELIWKFAVQSEKAGFYTPFCYSLM